MKISFLFLTMLAVLQFISSGLFAQYSDTLKIERPGQSIGSGTIGRGSLQLESGFNYEPFPSLLPDYRTISHTSVLRFGVLRHLEASAVFGYSHTRSGAGLTEYKVSGINTVQLGARYHFTDNDGLLPAIALQARAILPVASGDFDQQNVGAKIVLATSNKLSDRFDLVTNWIYTNPGRNAAEVANYAWAVGYSINERWGSFIEMFGRLDDFETSIDGGVSYLVNSNLTVDMYAGVFDGPRDYFIDAGVTWRIVERKR